MDYYSADLKEIIEKHGNDCEVVIMGPSGQTDWVLAKNAEAFIERRYDHFDQQSVHLCTAAAYQKAEEESEARWKAREMSNTGNLAKCPECGTLAGILRGGGVQNFATPDQNAYLCPRCGTLFTVDVDR